MKKICISLHELRRRFPWSRIDQRTMFDQIPELKNVSDAVMSEQRAKDYFTSVHYLRTYERADWYMSPAPLRLFTWRFVRALRKKGLPFYVHTCWRDPVLQVALKKNGKSGVKSGAHQRSSAVDIVHAVNHWEIPDDLWYYVGTLGEAVARDTNLGTGLDGKPLKIEWGGRWKRPYDPAHWQLSDWKHRPIVGPHTPLKLSPYSKDMTT